MSRCDRAFRDLLVCALGAGAVLSVPLAITLFPGAIEEALHGYESVVQTCAAALYEAGRQLPHLGVIVLALAASALAAVTVRAARLVRRTAALAHSRRQVEAPAALRRAAAGLGIAERVHAFVDAAPAAYTTGLLTPQIWISTGALERLAATELGAVLLHERFHLRQRDPLRIVIARILAEALFAVPVVRAHCARFEVAKELDADRHAVLAGGAPALAGALVRLDSGDASIDAAVGAWSLTSARIDQLELGEDDDLLPRARRAVRWSSAAMLALALMLGTGQALRANIVPASLFTAIGMQSTGANVHQCPLPMEGVLF